MTKLIHQLVSMTIFILSVAISLCSHPFYNFRNIIHRNICRLALSDQTCKFVSGIRLRI